ncbi:carbohydrate-binding module family 6 protein [Zopfia rhizophila CBS 207.26]|uniref:Carbohydrate-binding module family 6 protein n=1 Tax=Zopfia rhizophila CBS 207.26 TaxID=1314779 RepID=A0A6A6EGT3_9PEZI|nr:carbohydrate-binding module family 6 protein [Zopfia rhizophila CBS 207.26]
MRVSKPWPMLRRITAVSKALLFLGALLDGVDPGPLVYNGRVYIYTGHDENGSTNFNMRDWRLCSLANTNAWAGQVTPRNGKFYYYVPIRHSTTGGMAIGVGVSDSITGPFRDAIGRPLVENGQIDPTVFIDDNGQAYLYWGNPDLWYVKLNQDMISYSGSLTKDIRYSTGTSPTGPWTYRGVIMPKQGKSFTNHPGIIDFNNTSYFFYHNGALPGGSGYTRSVAVERFVYNSDGTIPTIQMSTGGAPQVGTLNPYVRQEAETMAWSSDVETEVCSEGGIDVSYINNGDYIKVKGVASATSGGKIELRLGSVTGTLVGTCTTCPVSGATGT